MKNNTPLLIAALACLLSLAVMIAVLIRPDTDTERPVFTPPAFDGSAVLGTPDVPEHLGWGKVDAQVYQVWICGAVMIEDDKADIWLTNPQSNTVWLKLRVLDAEGNTLGETGLIRPGEYVQSVTFDTIPETGDAIGLKLMAYEPETYYSAGSATLDTVVYGRS